MSQDGEQRSLESNRYAFSLTTHEKVRRVNLLFEEDKQNRTQEFVLRWSVDKGRPYQEILRQQYTFSPPDTIREIEDYIVNLDGLTALELKIMPDTGSASAFASLNRLRVM